ncbi:MAG: spore coat protein, partial [SAR202 cluster bacterium]|nr:spore coat protein [SAR202 cluster bacterium]
MTAKVVAIVQARMGSSRLPGKVLLPLGGRPVLWHVTQRLAAARSLDGTLIATSVLPLDDAIADAAASWGVPWCRGSEGDVLDRYYQAACQAAADVVVRLPADKPLLHPGLVDEAVAEHLRVGADYTSNTPADFPKGMTYPYGLEVEVVGFPALERAWREATD